MTDFVADDIDRAILDLLYRDSRMSLRSIGAAVGLAAPSIRDRILRMEDLGVIEGFGIRINRRKLGYTLEAILRVEPLPGKLHSVEKTLEALPEIVECSVVTGEDCFVARLVLREIGDLDRLLGPLHDMARTKTSIVHRQPVPLRNPPV
ncbi:Lrp/AsnC family transcriptional regulator [Cohaesibacter marisflavi]|nr:Lrp/AsnC family transcriptional regulator [Cohaesibacter marisflavi]